MIRIAILLVLASLPMLSDGAAAGGAKKGDAILAIQRGGGFVNPDANPFAHYSFSVAKDGAWELKPLKGPSKKGKLGADEIGKWLKAIEDAGFRTMKSNPALGAADEPYMDITVQLNDTRVQKRIRLEAALAQALDKKILALAKPGK
jgi:hypothetical protein